MNKRIISTVIAATLFTTTLLPTISVSAEPMFDKDTQNKYSEIEGKYNELEQKVQELDDQISALICKINENDAEIENVNKEIDNTKKEIEQKKQDIEAQEEILGKRLRELYKSGGQNSYISLVFSAESLSDLVAKIDDTAKLINLDKKVVKELGDSKEKLDNSVTTLEKKSDEIKELNEELQEQKVDLDSKKKEQQVATEQVKAEKEKFEAENLIPMETAQVSPWITQATDNNTSIDEKKYAVEILKTSLGQIKSDTVKAQVQDAINKGNTEINDAMQKLQESASAVKSPAVTASTSTSGSSINTSVVPSKNASDLINYAMRFLGVKYVWGGTDPSGFDCSGFTQYVFSHAAGIGLGRTTYEQINNGVEVSRANLQPGDLIFPNEGHVAIYIGNGQMIHAPHTGDVVKVSSVYAFWRARRIL